MKIDVLNNTCSFSWDGVDVPMVPRGYWDKTKIAEFWKKEHNSLMDDDAELIFARQLEESFAMKKLLTSKYEPFDLKRVVNEQEHLTIPERLLLEKVLCNCIRLFQGLCGSWEGKPIHLEFVPRATPYATKPFPIPQAYTSWSKKRRRGL